MSTGIDLKGVNEVLSQFDYRETPFYAVYQGKDLKFYNANDDIEASRNMLAQHLEQLEKNGSTAPFKIVFYKKAKDGFDELDKSSELGSNTFRVVAIGMSMQNFYALQRGDEIPYPKNVGGVNDAGINKILESLNAIDSRLTAIETPLMDEDEQEDKTPTLMGVLGGVLNHPDMIQMIGAKLIGLLSMIPTAMPTPVQQHKIYAMPIEEKDLPQLNEYLKILVEGGMSLDDFKKLSNICQTNPTQFAWLLSMLKSA